MNEREKLILVVCGATLFLSGLWWVITKTNMWKQKKQEKAIIKEIKEETPEGEI